MEAEEVLRRVRTGEDLPDSWMVFPLLRKQVLIGISGWVVGLIMGLGLLALIAPVMIPDNYQRGVGVAIFSTLLLGVLLFVTIGSIWFLINDGRRLRQADKHLIVITDEIFVKQEGDKITCVPLAAIRYVTPRGRASAQPETEPRPASSVAILGGMFGAGRNSKDGSNPRQRRQRMRAPTSLAFIDTRTNREVTVINDSAYGDSFSIATVLKEYTTIEAAQH
jgi:hypothetical protein